MSESSPADADVAVPALIGALKDKNEKVRIIACKSLAGVAASALRAGPDRGPARLAIEGLIGALTSPIAVVRIAAADSLSDLGAAGSALKTMPPLGTTEPQVVITALDRVLDDPDESVRLAAARALGYFGDSGPPTPPRLIKALEHDASTQARLMAMVSVTRFRNGLDDAILALIRIANGPEKAERSAAAEALSNLARNRSSTLTPAVVPALVAGVQSPDRVVRFHSAQLLRKFGPEAKDAVVPLLAALRQPADPLMASAKEDPITWDPAVPAAEALGRIAPETAQADEVLSSFLDTLKGSGSARRKGAVADGLAGFDRAKVEPTIPVLIEMLNVVMRQNGPPGPALASALGRVAPGTAHANAAIATLTTALNAPAPFVRAAAARALGHFGRHAKGVLAKLNEMAEKDQNFGVKTAAFDAAEKIEEATAEATKS